MHEAVARQKHSVPQLDMTGHQCAIGQSDVITDDAVVSDVTVRHEITIRTDHGIFFQFVRTMDGEVFPKSVPVPDPQTRRFIGILQILRCIADDAARMKDIPAPDLGMSGEMHLGADAAIGSDHDIGINDRIRPHVDAGIDFCIRMNDGGGMDHRSRRMLKHQICQRKRALLDHSAQQGSPSGTPQCLIPARNRKRIMIVSINVHSSQFPEQLQVELLESLRTRKINHKFHYESRRQAKRWLDLHQKYSPSRNDSHTRELYGEVFGVTAKFVESPAAHIIGLGCGGGEKDMVLIEKLQRLGKMLVYSACDSSVPLVLVSRQKALKILDERHVHDLVADFTNADDLQRIFITQTTGNSTRVINFLGMIPNFEPEVILPVLSSLIRPNDLLVFSANLAPGDNYLAGIRKVLKQYDNPETRAWLTCILEDLGLESNDGELKFSISENVNDSGLHRIEAHFEFAREWKTAMDGEEFEFVAGNKLRVFYSYRHTSETVREWLAKESIEVVDERLACNGEEGIFICRKNSHSPQ